MFTGIVEAQGEILEITQHRVGRQIRVDLGDLGDSLQIGESIAINGCCLTVVSFKKNVADFDIGAESLSKTTMGHRESGHRVNLERALVASDRLGGHIVTGHVDGVGVLVDRIDDDEWSTLWFEIPAHLASHLAPKGSVAVDGVSLTVVEVSERRFSVALIPHTLAVTSLGQLGKRDEVNIETDILAKYVERQIASRFPSSDSNTDRVS